MSTLRALVSRPLAERVKTAAFSVAAVELVVSDTFEGEPGDERAREIIARCAAELAAEARRLDHAEHLPLRLVVRSR